ncbi:unnamed protein product [Ectocarpus sp. CCAP 1310/34]|nr:unnamed protein product [Ectocarpus sp. CCAP 1310/34]
MSCKDVYRGVYFWLSTSGFRLIESGVQ